MTPEQGNIAIAEWMGFRTREAKYDWCGESGSFKQWQRRDADQQWHDCALPNFHSDLNAMAEAVVKLNDSPELRRKYRQELWHVVNKVGHFLTNTEEGQDWLMLNATAPQRWEALLRTLNIWKD